MNNVPITWCYYDLWYKSVSCFYLIILKYLSTFPTKHQIPLDIIRYICLLYIKEEMYNIPINYQCPCNLQQCQIEWLKLNMYNMKVTDVNFKERTIWQNKIHCMTNNCHVMFSHICWKSCELCSREFCDKCMAKGRLMHYKTYYEKIDTIFNCNECIHHIPLNNGM